MSAAEPRFTARAVVLGERIDVSGLQLGEVVARNPLAFRAGGGVAVVFRYGVVVMVGVPRGEQDGLLGKVLTRATNPPDQREEESLEIAGSGSPEDSIGPDGVVRLADLGVERLLLVADALAKTAALAQDERRVARVLDTVEPWAQALAAHGRHPRGRRRIVRQIGAALLMQHRLSERVAVREKPDILWDRPDLERLHARLAVEFELAERAEALDRKLLLVREAVAVLTDLIDTERSLRLEAAIVALIVAEFGLTLAQMLGG